MLRSDPAATALRIDALAAYMSANVLSPARCGEGEFVCASKGACKGSVGSSDFHAGQLSHVGAHYDLWDGDRPLRVVVVGQEQGAKPARVTLDAKAAMMMESGLLRRYSADGNYKARNPHMRGTTSALRMLLGGELGDDHNGEFLDLTAGKRVHMFDAFALVNALLCGAHPPNTTRGNSTPVMRANCLRHFTATLRVLEPTVVVLQRRGVAEWTGHLFEAVEPVNAYADRARFEGRELYLCRFTHPAARAPQHWGNSLSSAYLLDKVVPTLRLVREHALG